MLPAHGCYPHRAFISALVLQDASGTPAMCGQQSTVALSHGWATDSQTGAWLGVRRHRPEQASQLWAQRVSPGRLGSRGRVTVHSVQHGRPSNGR